MEVLVVKDYDSISKEAGQIFIEAIKNKPNIVLGLATGSTPIGMYKEMIKAHKEEGLDFSKVVTFNLDEYVGLTKDHPSSYRYFMDNELFNHINIDKNNTNVPDGKANNLEEFCGKYDEMIKEAGGIDIQVLGVGENGHIAFNEPEESLSAGTSIVKLTDNTIEVNARFFDSMDEVPKQAITMGMGSILKSRKIVLLANGEKKAPVIKKLLNENRVSTMFPVSFLYLHPDVTVIVDEAAYNG